MKRTTIKFAVGVEDSDDENRATCACGETIVRFAEGGWFHEGSLRAACQGRDDGVAEPTAEVERELPAVFEVCDRCEGHGTHLTPSIGEHAYSREEFEEAFSEDEDRDAYFRRGGIYDVVCQTCHGENVVSVVDRDACQRDPKLAALLAEYDAQQRDDEAYERDCEAERRMGC